MDIDRIIKALANPARRDILQWLKEPEKHFPDQEYPLSTGVCAGQFERCGLSQSTISTHLATLQRAELVIAHSMGQWVFYKRNDDTSASFLSTLDKKLEPFQKSVLV